MFVGNILGFALIALQRQRALLVLYIVLAVGNILANLVFIPWFGGIGAAWVTVVTEGVATSVASYLVYERLEWTIAPKHLLKIIGCTLGAALLLVLLPSTMPAVI